MVESIRKTNTIGFLTIIVLLSITSVFSLRLFLQQRIAQDKLDIHTFPYEIGEWAGKDLEITEQEYDILETKNLILREYENPEGKKISVFIIYSETNRAVFHPPEVCLIGEGMKVIDKGVEKINSEIYKLSVNKMVTEKGNHKGISLYCYKAGKLYTDNFYLQQVYFALNQLLGRHQGGATIRVSMPMKHDDQTSLATLKTFFLEVAKIIENLPA